MKRQRLVGAVAYWTLVGALIAFGAYALFSIGFPFLLIGFTLAVLSGARHSPLIFWPPVVAVLMLIVGYLLLAPLSCTSEASLSVPGSSQRGFASMTCERLLLPDYVGTHEPSHAPAMIGAVVIALAAGIVTRLLRLRLAGGANREKASGDVTDWRGAETFFYWFLVAILMGFGVMGLIGGYGLPILVIGFALALLAGGRRRPDAFWPPLVGVIVFMAAYALIGPLSCTYTERTSSSGPPILSTTCTRLLLPDADSFATAFWPALTAAAAVGAVAGWAVRRRMLWDGPEHSSPAGGP